jgi:hypothetical protein
VAAAAVPLCRWRVRPLAAERVIRWADDNMSSSVDKLKGILAAVPGFTDRWTAFMDAWSNEPPLPLYVGMSELAHYVVDRLERGETTEFPQLFAEVEHLMKSGDAETQNVIVAGLFEDIQNIASHRMSSFDVFFQWLGPTSAVAWKEIDEGMQHVAQRAAARRIVSDVPPEVDVEDMLDKVANPELRKIIEAMYRSGKR